MSQRIKHIVVPTSLSEACSGAYAAARRMAAAYGARVTILHVDEHGDWIDDNEGAFRQLLRRIATERARQGREAVAFFGARDVVASFEVVAGDVRRRLNACMKERGADLVVMARSRSGAAGRTGLGSVTKRVLRHSGLPVLVVPRPDADAAGRPNGAGQWRHLLVASDHSPTSRLGLRAAARLARKLGAHITLVNVIRTPPPLATVHHASGVALELTARRELKRRLVSDLQQLLAEECPGLSSDAMVMVDERPSEGILRGGLVSGVDLIALPTVGKGFIDRLVLGSTAERVSGSADVPVLVMPKPWLESEFPMPSVSPATD